jgi:N-acetylglucosaminyl-diphospho-decaprenol L-rhamnosyltransferase
LSELDLAVVVVSWNVRDLLLECLASACRAMDSARLRGEIWVVDNASHDDSVEAVRTQFGDDTSARLTRVQTTRVQPTRVHLIASPANLWFGGGQNLALRAIGFDHVELPSSVEQGGIDSLQLAAADGQRGGGGAPNLPRYVLVLNPDTLIGQGALGAMVEFMDRSPRVGVCGPRLVYGDGRFQHAAYRFPSLAQTVLDFWPLHWRLTESRFNGRYPRRLYESGVPFPIDHPLGAAMLFRRETIQQTGGFDLDYRMYVEEIDWCMRVKRAGWDIYCVPEAEIVHYEGQSTRQVRPRMIVALWRSRYIYFHRYTSPVYCRAVRYLTRAGMRAKIRRAQDALRRNESDEASIRALIDAYRQVIELE